MKAFEVRNMTDQEIQTKMEEIYEEMFNLRFQHAVGQAKDSNRVKSLKRDVARMKTILNERAAAAQ